jgi:tetratricopeptide (TPR) repeat protein
MGQKNEFNDYQPVDRLDSHARELYYELRLSGRRPIAVVGSGMSVPYGGVSWPESIKLALNEALMLLKNLEAIIEESTISESKKRRYQNRRMRALAGVVALNQDGAMRQSSEKYLAMDLAKDAFMVAAEITGDVAPENPKPDFLLFMQDLFKNNKQTLTAEIMDQFSFTAENAQTLRAILSSTCIYWLAEIIFSHDTLAKLAKLAENDQVCIKLAREIKACCQNTQNALPQDLHSLLSVFLADLDVTCRQKLLQQLKKKAVRKINGKSELSPARRPMLDQISELFTKFDLRRAITLNFDFELENALVIDDLRATKPASYDFAAALKDSEFESADVNDAPDSTLSPPKIAVNRRFSDGLAAASDIYIEGQGARLFEFALNSSDYRMQILHLHGRADVPDSMLLTESDLNRIYRRDPNFRTTLEQALDVVLTGNPILFVGLGLSEPEITRSLRQLVSEGRATPSNPAFAIDVIHDGGDNALGGTDAWRRQLALYKQFGIHFIAAGHPRHNPNEDLAHHRHVIGNLIALIDALSSDDRSIAARLRNKITMQTWRAGFAKLGYLEKLPVDRLAFWHIAPRIISWKPASKLQPHTAASWKYYLRKLENKFISQAIVIEINRLSDDLRTYAERESFTSVNDEKDRRNDDYSHREWQFQENKITPPICTYIHRHAINITGSNCGGSVTPSNTLLASKIRKSSQPISVYLAPIGSGKGAIVRKLSQILGKVVGGQEWHRIFVNCTFGIEFESAVILILEFFWQRSNISITEKDIPKTNRLAALERAINAGVQPAYASDTRPPVLVLTGVERLIDCKGQHITPELDLLLQILLRRATVQSGFRIILFGTPECRPAVGKTAQSLTALEFADLTQLPEFQRGDDMAGFCSFLLKYAKDAASARNLKLLSSQLNDLAYYSHKSIVPNGPRSEASKQLITLVLENWHLLTADATRSLAQVRTTAELEKKILSVLAFVGMPIELTLLKHFPALLKLASKVASTPGEDIDKIFEESINRLYASGMLLKVRAFRDEHQGAVRLVLHRAVLAEIRDRYGLRNGEELLSNSFFLTLAVSLPTDLVIADDDMHLELSSIVGFLRGAWKDAILSNDILNKIDACREYLFKDSQGKALTDGGLHARRSGYFEDLTKLERCLCLQLAPMHASLRAAGGIVRSFFSAATLVSAHADKVTNNDKGLGEFEEHKRRISGILSRYRDTLNAAKDVDDIIGRLGSNLDNDWNDRVSKLKNAIEIEKAAKLRLSGNQPAVAFYSGELLWLLNEQAVIAMLQGDLYGGETAFREAYGVLRAYKGEGSRQSWRRLEINRTLLLVERGRIGQARSHLDAIDGKMAAQKYRSAQEDAIIKPLIIGYKGYCDFINGFYKGARTNYGQAIELLCKDNQQQRALALFYWRRAELEFNLNNVDDALKDVQFSIGAAEAGRQIDVVWRARLLQARLLSGKDKALAEAIFTGAIKYAEQMDLPRISVMALGRYARHRLELGDVEAASSLAKQSMIFAGKNGMTLERISLRVLMGTILLSKGDRSGLYLLRRAIAHADRIGFQQQVDRAHRALLDDSRRKISYAMPNS